MSLPRFLLRQQVYDEQGDVGVVLDLPPVPKKDPPMLPLNVNTWWNLEMIAVSRAFEKLEENNVVTDFAKQRVYEFVKGFLLLDVFLRAHPKLLHPLDDYLRFMSPSIPEGPDDPDFGVRMRIMCHSKFTFSVQASSFHYSHPRNNRGPYQYVEVGFPYPTESDGAKLLGPWNEGRERPEGPNYNDVYSYVPVEIVLKVIEVEGGVEAGELPNFESRVWPYGILEMLCKHLLS